VTAIVVLGLAHLFWRMRCYWSYSIAIPKFRTNQTAADVRTTLFVISAAVC